MFYQASRNALYNQPKKSGLIFLAGLLFIGSVVAIPLPEGYMIPQETRSLTQRYGFLVPIFHLQYDKKDVHNALVDTKTGKVIATINAPVGFDRSINYIKILKPWWSNDESLVLWEVAGKWSSSALVLIKFHHDVPVWQLNVLAAFQKEILSRVKAADPKKYEAVRKQNAGCGSAFPDGFTITVEPVLQDQGSMRPPLELPLPIHVTLTSNPKKTEGLVDLNATMDGEVKQNGTIEIKRFQLLPH